MKEVAGPGPTSSVQYALPTVALRRLENCNLKASQALMWQTCNCCALPVIFAMSYGKLMIISQVTEVICWLTAALCVLAPVATPSKTCRTPSSFLLSQNRSAWKVACLLLFRTSNRSLEAGGRRIIVVSLDRGSGLLTLQHCQ